MSDDKKALKAQWKASQKAIADEFGLGFGGAHPETGMIWASGAFNTPKSFEQIRRRGLLYNAKSRAKQAGRECTITMADMNAMWPKDGRCPVLPYVTLTWADQNYASPSIDRIDSTKGYTPENCQILSMRANRLKSDASFEEVVLLHAHMLRTYPH